MNQMASPPPAAWNEAPKGPPGPGSAATLPVWQAPEPTPEIVELWRAVMQRKWAILALTLLVGALAWFVVEQIRPVYRSTATVLLEAAPNKVVSQIEDVVAGASASREHFQTQAEVMKGRDVAERVIRKLGLATHPEFDPRQRVVPAWRQWIDGTLPLVATLIEPPRGPLDEAGARERVLQEFAERLSVEPVRLSQLVRVRFESHDPALAATIANTVAEAYIAQDRENRVAVTAGAGDWIRERMAELKRKLDRSDAALQAYRDKEGLLDSKTTVLSGSGRQLDELTNKLVEAGVRRSLAEEAYKQVKGGDGGGLESVPAVVRSTSVQNAKAVENELSKKLAEVSQRYGPDHPRNVAAAAELKTAQQNTQKEIRAVVESLVREYQAAVATEKSLEGQLKDSKGTIQTLNRKEIQLSTLEREAATNRQLYETFLTRYGETTATRDSQQPTARVVDRAVAAIKPVRPQKLPTVGVALGGGLLVGVLAALFVSRLNNSVKTSSDVETKLRQPFLASLPIIGLIRRKHAGRMVLEHPDDLYAEGIRTASTGIMLSALDSPRKIISVTSSVPGEGKSTFAANLALSQARSRPTVLVEADLRRPVLMKMLSIDSERKGVSDILSGAVTLDDALLKIEGSELQVLPSGTLPPDPLGLVSSRAFADLLLELQRRFDFVVVDCPPVQVVSDALMLGSVSTGMIYVVKADDTPLATARAGIKRLNDAGIKLIGVVLNQHDHRRAAKYYGETYGYGKYSYKGYGYAKKTS
jgi:succinoglycan biosynthesis transport protein ExoP